MKQRSVLSIAREVRKWTEEYAWKHPHVGTPENLLGYCAIASGELCERLKANGYSPKIAWNDQHVFVMLDDKVLDVTASQFGGPKVVYRKHKNTENAYWYIIDRMTDSKNKLRRSQRLTGWPREQWAR